MPVWDEWSQELLLCHELPPPALFRWWQWGYLGEDVLVSDGSPGVMTLRCCERGGVTGKNRRQDA